MANLLAVILFTIIRFEVGDSNDQITADKNAFNAEELCRPIDGTHFHEQCLQSSVVKQKGFIPRNLHPPWLSSSLFEDNELNEEKAKNDGCYGCYKGTKGSNGMAPGEEYCACTGRVIVPTSLRSRILKALHIAHPGIVRMKALARRHVYWPGMYSEIEKVVSTCEECQLGQKKPTKAPLSPWPTTDKVFQRVHVDFAGPCSDGHQYLILIDSFSKWPEVYRMNTISAYATVFVLRSIIFRLGIPEEIVSDNGTQFR